MSVLLNFAVHDRKVWKGKVCFAIVHGLHGRDESYMKYFRFPESLT